MRPPPGGRAQGGASSATGAFGPHWPLLATPPRRRAAPGSPVRPLAIYAAVALAVLALDIITKRWSLAFATYHPGWGDLVHLTVVHNARLLGTVSLGGYAPAAHSAVFLLLIALSAAVCRRLTSIDRLAPLAFGLLIGGALGNGIELLTARAAATDFLAVAYGPGAELVFNVADMAALAGLALLAGTTGKLVSALRATWQPTPTAQRAPRLAPVRMRADVEVPRAVFSDGAVPASDQAGWRQPPHGDRERPRGLVDDASSPTAHD